MTAAVSNLAHYQFQDDGADNNTSTLLGSEDTANTGLSLDTVYFLRFKVTNTGGMDVSNFAPTLQADIGGAGFFNVTTSSTDVRAVAGQDDDGDLCDTERLTDDGGTFATTGTYSEDGTSTTITLVAGEMYEICFSITFRSADLTAGSEEIDLKVLNGGAALNNLLVTAEATMPAAGGITETPGVGSLTLTGLAPTLIQTFSIAVPVGSLTLNGQTPIAVVNTIIAVPVGSLTLTGFAPTVEISHVAVPGVGTLALTGQIPTLVQTNNHIRAPPVGSLTLTGQIPTVNITQAIDVPVGSLTLTGNIPTLQITQAIPVPVGSLSLTGFAPTVIQTFSIDVPVGSLSLTGLAPTVTQGFSIDVPLGSLTLTGLAPTVERSFVATPGVGSLTLTGQVPTLIDSGAGGETVTPGVGSLTLTGLVPTLVQTFSIAVPVGTLTITGLVPGITVTVPPPFGVFFKVSLAPGFASLEGLLLTEDGGELLFEDGSEILIRSGARIPIAHSAFMTDTFFASVTFGGDIYTSVNL